jgi:Asp-tRNA(Asn)/Glu-tRNA(Gln) amidotransferase C subunit
MINWLRKDLEKSKERVAQMLKEIKVMDDKLFILERIA